MTTHEALGILLAPDWYAPIACMFACTIHTLLDGECDARHFDRPVSPRQDRWPDIHTTFTARRSCLWVLVALLCGIPTAIGCVLMFAYLHDGNYYSTRKMIDGNSYPKGWASEASGTSTALHDFSYRTRSILAALGLLIIIAVVYCTAHFPMFVR